jgi:arylsulfatase A-like enzyme
MNHHIGKWHLGFYSNEYTPTYRGFHKSNGYLLGAQNHYDQQNNQTFDDYLCSGGPPRLYDIWSGSMLNEVDNQTTREERQGIYNSYSFSQQTTDLIYSHSSQHPSSPLFVYLALQNTHKPLEVPPQKYMDLYPSIKYKTQQIFYAMVSVIDDIMNNITIALKVTGMWNNTLIIWVSDNGSPVEGAGSNWPLKGSKKSNWEGGVKTPAFVSGGYLPPSQRNKSLTGMIHLVDWYSTISSLAGLDPNDTKGPTPVDGLNMWPWITGQIEESPRSHIVFDHYLYNGPPAWGAIRVDNYKLLVGPQNYSSWYGGPENNYFTPNYSDPNPDIDIFECDYDKPCLYDIREDPTEHIDISSSRPDILSSMMDYWRSLYNEYHPPRRKPIDDTTGYCRAASLNNWYVTPWITNTSDTNLPGKYMKDREILTKFPDHLDIFGNP